jgi:hypothetical protein
MSALAVTPYHAESQVSAANRLPVSAEVIGSVAVTGTMTLGASTLHLGRMGRSVVSALASVSPSGRRDWPAGGCLAAGTPAILVFAFGAGCASRYIALRTLRIAATVRGVEPLAAGLLAAGAAFDPAADGAPPASAALEASTLEAFACEHVLAGDALDLCVWRGTAPLLADADGKLYGQLYLVRPWSVTDDTGLTISAVLTGDLQ